MGPADRVLFSCTFGFKVELLLIVHEWIQVKDACEITSTRASLLCLMGLLLYFSFSVVRCKRARKLVQFAREAEINNHSFTKDACVLIPSGRCNGPAKACACSQLQREVLRRSMNNGILGTQLGIGSNYPVTSAVAVYHK